MKRKPRKLASKTHQTEASETGHGQRGGGSPKRIFLVEDHPTFREGLVRILKDEPGLEVCGQAGNAAQALKGIRRLQPDLLLLDITLPGKSGLQLIKELRAEGCRVKVLVLSMHDEAVYAARVLRAGGDGYLMKEEDPEEIVQAIRDVLAGSVYVSEQVLARSSKSGQKGGFHGKSGVKGWPLEKLTDRELELLELLGRGKTSREIARSMGLSPQTVLTHCARIKMELKLESDNALIRYAVCWVETGGA